MGPFTAKHVAPLCLLLSCVFIFPFTAFASHPCFVIHGRAKLYDGDGQLRIWHIGTHHEFEPDETSSDRVDGWLIAGTPKDYPKEFIAPESHLFLFGDFTVCPTEPLRRGAVQKAKIMAVKNRHYVGLAE
jgi:hypothetical protein